MRRDELPREVANRDEALVTVSVVSHGQREFVGALVKDLVRLRPRRLARFILTLNRPEPLPDGLDALSCEVLVLRNDHARGFAANHNRAFRFCRTPWFAVLNPDLRVERDFVTETLRRRQHYDALLTPRIVEPGGTTADASRRLLTPWQLVLRLTGHREAADPRHADWMAGICVLLRSAAFASVGGFDERYFLYLEDADLCLRLKLAGWNVRQIDAVAVTHDARRTSHRSLRYLGWHVASLIKHWLSPVYWRYLRERTATGAVIR